MEFFKPRKKCGNLSFFKGLIKIPIRNFEKANKTGLIVGFILSGKGIGCLHTVTETLFYA